MIDLLIVAVYYGGIIVGGFSAYWAWGKPNPLFAIRPEVPIFYGFCMACMGDINHFGTCGWCEGYQQAKAEIESEKSDARVAQ